ncbi:2-polyprenyl-6-methoxyphenol hydroxylase [hydrothermal vent metagenome]|uniref:2-polyprenyl-6-methoxyphenol hydroxylase n=1 Tax=hydrothermal vent metagenome TaxID=652676 RepID=A0A3B1A8C8_9ZZZZ
MNKTSHTDYDVIIIGGGLVGGSLACALQNSSLRVAVIEAYPFHSEQQPSFDSRTVALAYGSKQIFESMELWSDIERGGVAAIKDIHVSDRGHIGATHLSSSAFLHNSTKITALGYVVENRVIGEVINRRLLDDSSGNNIDYLCPAKLTALTISPSLVTAEYQLDGTTDVITANVIIAADGGNSKVRELTNTAVSTRDYQQCAIIANVAMQYEHHNIAFERFTDSGPFAMLPTTTIALDATNTRNNRCSMVWTIRAEQQQEFNELDDATFIKRLENRFGNRLGHVEKLGERFIYPLSLMTMRDFVQPRLAYIGNAAHTLHPVAGQGFNLGLRDVAVLAEVLVDAQNSAEDLGSLQVLKRYAQWRRRDQQQAALITDSLVKIFSSSFTPIVVARNLGLMATELFPPLKNLLTRSAIGMSGKLPRLARRLKL